ncbi:OB-fold nucleic acid binding domain [Macleaya cordata]|uniref:OB-fold nucleic acid binding domain n=1 Tax=Macleaya cordata TaxID=56857 RepID=A0A200R8H5_MACCD|nr:OB-fold nucleic acid binding domain [Macleaya cordata]
MYSSQFDGNAAFSGGGFMPSQATQSTDFGVSPAKNRDSQGLFPLTVKQISESYLSSEDKANFVVDGVDVNNVTLVGMVFNKGERVTEVTFTLDDGTGRVDCHRWMNDSIDTKEMEEIQDGMYACIHGHLKGFQGKKHLVAFSVRPVTDFNQIACHFIECMAVHCHNTRSQKVQGGAQAQPQITSSTITNGSTGCQTAASNQFSGQFSFDGIKGIDQKVLDYLQQPANLGREKGVHRDELVQHLKVPLEKIMESIRSLEEEGAIYSTIDDCHYKSTVNG